MRQDRRGFLGALASLVISPLVRAMPAPTPPPLPPKIYGTGVVYDIEWWGHSIAPVFKLEFLPLPLVSPGWDSTLVRYAKSRKPDLFSQYLDPVEEKTMKEVCKACQNGHHDQCSAVTLVQHPPCQCPTCKYGTKGPVADAARKGFYGISSDSDQQAE